MTILVYARMKEWPLRSVEVECSHRRVHREDCENCETSDRVYVDEIRRRILLDAELTQEQADRLLYIAGRCPIHRMLEARPRIVDELEVVEQASP